MENVNVYVNLQNRKGVEVIVFNETTKKRDENLSKDSFLSFYEAIDYVEEISKKDNVSINDIFYETPKNILKTFSNLEQITAS